MSPKYILPQIYTLILTKNPEIWKSQGSKEEEKSDYTQGFKFLEFIKVFKLFASAHALKSKDTKLRAQREVEFLEIADKGIFEYLKKRRFKQATGKSPYRMAGMVGKSTIEGSSSGSTNYKKKRAINGSLLRKKRAKHNKTNENLTDSNTIANVYANKRGLSKQVGRNQFEN